MGQLVGMGELIKLLGVGRPRAGQLSKHPSFPAPVASLIMGSVWDLEDIKAWAVQRGRTLDLQALAGRQAGDTDDA